MKRVALTFRHGLGDAAQFAHVLRHIQHHRPEWAVDVYSLLGKHSLFGGLCRETRLMKGDWKQFTQGLRDSGDYDEVKSICWPENWGAFSRNPSTKTAKCLKEVIRLDFDGELLAELEPAKQAKQAAAAALNSICGVPDGPLDVWDSVTWPVVAIHYEANTGRERKNLDHKLIGELCDELTKATRVPLILDWDDRSPLPARDGVHCFDKHHPLWKGYGTGDGEALAALLGYCELVIGVDSGPLHVAQLVNTPSIGVWREHFPGQFIDPHPKQWHLIPSNWRDYGLADRDPARAYFEANYRHREYRSLDNALIPAVMEQIGEMDGDFVPCLDHLVRRDNYEQDLTIVRDVYLEDCYRLNLIPGVVEQAKLIVDVGACLGAFHKRVRQMNSTADVECVEVCPENWDVLEANIGHDDYWRGACSYSEEPLALLNAVRPNCESTGGSIVVSRAELTADQPSFNAGYAYRRDARAVSKWTLEEISGGRFIDLLKLDCEGSEFDILENADISRIGFIVGEYHGPDRWFKFLRERFADWDYGAMFSDGNTGLFHLRNTNPRRD